MNTYRTQRGAVLITSLVLLLILTLLGVAAMRNTTLEEKMAGNMHNRHIAEQAADAALRGGEDWLLELKTPPVASSTCTPSAGSDIQCLGFGFSYSPDPDDTNGKPWWKERDDAWWQSTATTAIPVNHVTKPAAYVVGELAIVPEGQSLAVGTAQDLERMTRYYEMTARGVDSSGRAEAISRTTFAAPNF